MSINKVMVTGNLCRDPEIRRTANGTAILGFTVAVNDRRRNQQTGEWDNVANFFDCSLFGNRAEGLERYLSKGMKVAIEGKLRQSQWQAQDGSKRSKIEIVVDEIEFMSQRQDGSQPQYQPQPTNYPQQGQMPVYGPQDVSQGYQQPNQAVQMAMQMAQQQPQQQPGEVSVFEDSIPF